MIRTTSVADVSARCVKVSTGATTTERIHQINQFDYLAGPNGTWTFLGNGTHLRDEDGRLLLVAGGKFVMDLLTGEILEATPNSNPNFSYMCKFMGG